MMEIGFFFNFENELIQLPVNPEELQISNKGKSKTYDVVSLGEVDVLKDRSLSEISFSTLLPNDTWFPPIRTKGDFRGPEFYHDFFERVYKSKKPIRFVVTGLNIDMLVSLKEYEYTYKAGEETDPYISIKLKEYRPYSIKTQAIKAEPVNDAWGSVTVVKDSSKGLDRPYTEITIGATVTLTGQVFRDSYGAGGGKSFKDTKCLVTLINKKGTHPYHVATTGGSPLGWVLSGAVKI